MKITKEITETEFMRFLGICDALQSGWHFTNSKSERNLSFLKEKYQEFKDEGHDFTISSILARVKLFKLLFVEKRVKGEK